MPQPVVRKASQRRPSSSSWTPRVADDEGTLWDQAVEAFLAEGRRKNLSAATLENYRWYIAGVRVQTYLRDHGIDSPAEFDATHLRTMEGEFLAAGLSARSVDTLHGVMKTFLRFCLGEGYGGDEKALSVKGPKLEQREPETFTDREIATLRAHLAKRPRDLMLIDLMLASGLRLQEVANLTLDDITESPLGGLVRVRQGKGKKDRHVPLDTPAARLTPRLTHYVARVRPKDTKQTALFLTHRKDDGDYLPLTASAIQTLTKRIGSETGVHLNPHKFRHTFATRSLAAGVDVIALQKALGHTTLAMVSKYVHFQSDDLLRAWSQRRD
jgi:site-specific recombinase XerD